MKPSEKSEHVEKVLKKMFGKDRGHDNMMFFWQYSSYPIPVPRLKDIKRRRPRGGNYMETDSPNKNMALRVFYRKLGLDPLTAPYEGIFNPDDDGTIIIRSVGVKRGPGQDTRL